MISLTMVLFVPGFMQRRDAWRPVAELLPERYPSTLLDHREHTLEGRLREIAEAGGPAARAARVAEGARTEASKEAARASSLASPVLVGYSLGGRLALRAALREP